MLLACSLGACAAPKTLSYRDLVMSTLRERQKVMRECYATALVDDPELAGRIAIRFTINDEGRILSAWVPEDEAIEPPEDMDPEQKKKQLDFLAMDRLPESVEACILSVVESTTFPPPEAGQEEPTYVYPMTFTPD
jgi:hypothetical protein